MQARQNNSFILRLTQINDHLCAPVYEVAEFTAQISFLGFEEPQGHRWHPENRALHLNSDRLFQPLPSPAPVRQPRRWKMPSGGLQRPKQRSEGGTGNGRSIFQPQEAGIMLLKKSFYFFFFALNVTSVPFCSQDSLSWTFSHLTVRLQKEK